MSRVGSKPIPSQPRPLSVFGAIGVIGLGSLFNSQQPECAFDEEEVKTQEKHLLVFGVTGSGKSTIINSLRDEEELCDPEGIGPAITSHMIDDPSMTTKCLIDYDMKDLPELGFKVVLWDTIGICDASASGGSDPMKMLISSLQERFGWRGEENPKIPLWGVILVVNATILNNTDPGFRFIKQLVDAKLVGSMQHAIILGTSWDRLSREQKDSSSSESFKHRMVDAFFDNVPGVEPNWAVSGYDMGGTPNLEDMRWDPRYVLPEGGSWLHAMSDEGKTIEVGAPGAVVVKTNKGDHSIEAAILRLPRDSYCGVNLTEANLIDFMEHSNFFKTMLNTPELQKDFVKVVQESLQEKEALSVALNKIRRDQSKTEAQKKAEERWRKFYEQAPEWKKKNSLRKHFDKDIKNNHKEFPEYKGLTWVQIFDDPTSQPRRALLINELVAARGRQYARTSGTPARDAVTAGRSEDLGAAFNRLDLGSASSSSPAAASAAAADPPSPGDNASEGSGFTPPSPAARNTRPPRRGAFIAGENRRRAKAAEEEEGEDEA